MFSAETTLPLAKVATGVILARDRTWLGQVCNYQEEGPYSYATATLVPTLPCATITSRRSPASLATFLDVGVR